MNRPLPSPSSPSLRNRDKVLVVEPVTTSLNSLLEPFSRCLDSESARKVSEFRIDQAVEARMQTLAELANEGLLNQDERSEYEALINATDLISILKLKARRHLVASDH